MVRTASVAKPPSAAAESGRFAGDVDRAAATVGRRGMSSFLFVGHEPDSFPAVLYKMLS
jgi:hypothetical protein